MAQKRYRFTWRYIALVLCCVVFLFSSTMLVRDALRAGKERSANWLLAQQIGAASGASPEQKYAESGVLLQYDALWQKNNDLAG